MMKTIICIWLLSGLSGFTSGGIIPQISGGSDASPQEFPWMGALFLVSGNRSYYSCGAVLYAPSKALTAAHCLNSHPTSYTVGFGFSNVTFPDPQYFQKSNVLEYRLHPEYNDALPDGPNDIAVLILETPMDESSPAVQKIPLATGSDDFVGQQCTVSGWGRLSSDGLYPNPLQKADMTVISEAECTPHFSDGHITDRQICALEPGIAPCHADSGSPMVCQGQLKGIVSMYQGDCSGSEPSIFTRITSYLDWIYQQ